MSIAWSTVVVLLLLSPGLLALLGLYKPLRVSRDVVPQTALSQLAFLICVSFVIHAPAYMAVNVLSSLCSWILPIDLAELFAILDLGVAKDIAASTIANNLHDNAGAITTYFVITGVAGFLVGWLVGWLIVKGPLQSLALHGWVFELHPSNSRATGLTFAYVLTNVKEKKRVLMYRGLLDEIHIGPDGKISYLTLREGERYYMVLQDNAPVTSASKAWKAIGQSAAKPAADAEHGAVMLERFLLIEGEDISNLVFESYTLISN